MSNLFDEIISFDNLYNSFKSVFKTNNKRNKEAILFARNETYNILKLQKELKEGTYKIGEYNHFKVYEPKVRDIHSLSFRDKVVQNAIMFVLKDFYSKKFINDTYACLDGKGTHAASEKIHKFMRMAKRNLNNPYVIKCDIKKYFSNIDRNILKQILFKNIKDINLRNLINEILESCNKISKNGIPLGNTTSQIFANLYLNEMDQYIKRVLKVKYYVRYMDDFMLILDGKEKAQYTLEQIKNYISKKLNLEFNIKKTKIFKLKQGINIVGYKTYCTHKDLRNTSKTKIKKRIKSILNHKIPIDTGRRMLASFKGLLERAKAFSFINFIKYKYGINLGGDFDDILPKWLEII